MMRKLTIQNFQAHKDSTFDLLPGINVITGASDAGKSSVIRALLWAITNRPQGDAFRSHFAGPKDRTKVSVEMDSGNVSIRRMAQGNFYEVDGEELKAIRTDVPEQVQRKFDLAEQNIQTQFVPYFLLQDTDGEVARKINAACDLGVIDVVLANANTAASTTALALDSAKKELELEKAEVAKLDWVEEAQNALGKLITLDNTIIMREGEIKELEAMVQALTEAQADLDATTEWLKVVPESKPLFTLQDKIARKTVEFQSVSKLVLQINEAKARLILIEDMQQIRTNTLRVWADLEIKTKRMLDIARITEQVTKLTHRSAQIKVLLDLKPELERLQELELQIETKNQRYRAVVLIANEIAHANKRLARIAEDLESRVAHFNSAMQTMKSCPVCGQETTHVHMEAHA